MSYCNYYKSKLGNILLTSDGENLTSLLFEGQKYYINNTKHQTLIEKKLPIFNQTYEWLNSYFNAENPNVSSLKLKPEGSNFRQNVWNILLNIPYGKTISYGDIAKEIAKNKGIKTMSSQAVGGAVGHNPISIIIPCHRVIGIKGNLTGFASGINNKIKLLQLENVDIAKMFIPKNGTAL